MRVRWTRPALQNLDDIQDFIATESPLAAYRLVHDLSQLVITGLGSAPLMGRPGRAPNTREMVFPDLPYIVVYRVGEAVEILAVMHTARRWPKAFD